MQTGTLLAVAALAVAAGAAAGATAAPSRGACTPGPTKVDGHPANVFCGPAKATVKVAGKAYAFKGGQCLKTGTSLTLNIGTVVSGVAKQKPQYLGLNIGRYYGANPGTPAAAKDGIYGGGLVVVRTNGKAWDLNGAADKDVKVTLKKKRTAGRFTGSTHFSPRVKVTGSFSC
jgi:hypothetical protein